MPRLPGTHRVMVDVLVSFQVQDCIKCHRFTKHICRYTTKEWYSHSIFLDESTPSEIIDACEHIEHICNLAFKGKNNLTSSGRLYNRIMLAMLVQNICTPPTGINSGDDEYPEALINLTPSDWSELIEKLEKCRSSLIKSNASTYPPEGTDQVDDELKDLPMFNDVYRDVRDLLQCHMVVSQFRKSLERASARNVNKLIDKYTRNLPVSFQDHALVSTLRKDVLSSPKRKTNVCAKIRADLKALLEKPRQPYSFDQLQVKVKTLARTWNESILGVPTLVRLGYGGVPDAANNEETKTVSSWGMDEQHDHRLSQHSLSSNRADEGEAGDDASDYHTADEIDEEDDEDMSSRMIQPHPELQALEVRPRESWKEDFTMIEDIQKVREDSDFHNCDDGDYPQQGPTKRRKHSLDWSESDDNVDDGLKPHERLARQRKRQEKRRAADQKRRKMFEYMPDTENIMDEIRERHRRRRRSREKRQTEDKAEVMAETQFLPRDEAADRVSVLLDAVERQPIKLPTYAEYVRKKRGETAESAISAPGQNGTKASNGMKKRPTRRVFFFSSEQTEILKEGVRKHGLDAWEKIVEEAGDQLAPRTASQCRDKYLVMVSQGEGVRVFA